MKGNFSLAVFSGLILWALGLNACSGKLPEEESSCRPDDRVIWDMSMDDSASRAVTESDGSGRFEPGDTIELYARNLADGSVRHLTLRLSDGQWMPQIHWSEIGEEVRFTAWHLSMARPLHQSGLTSSEYLHTLDVNQQGEGYDRSDLLCAQALVRAGEKVELRFNHAVSRLHVVLESRDASYADDELQRAEIQVHTPGEIVFDLADGCLRTSSGDRWITPSKQTGNTRTALVCPQQAEEMSAADWIRIRIDGRETSLKIPETVDGRPFEGMKAGHQLTYRLNLQKADKPDPFAGTTRWVYGIRPPTDDLWNFDHTQLAWTEGCGWFDCNKTNPSDISAGGDGLMCWAAATSNLIHWWLEQNRETEAVKAYNGPKAVPSDMLHSEIFQLYKDHFPNQGEYPLKAVNWFFNGVFHRKLYDTDPVDPAAGFFRRQLGTHSLGAEYTGTELMRDRFNALIRQALTSRQGILFVVNLGKAWTTHAVTLWGVKFDAEGLIETLYMVDNNDGRSDARGTIRTMEVRYLPYSAANPDLYPYVPNSIGDFTVRIEALCMLSLGSEWIR